MALPWGVFCAHKQLDICKYGSLICCFVFVPYLVCIRMGKIGGQNLNDHSNASTYTYSIYKD